jgi:hypothetical protein
MELQWTQCKSRDCRDGVQRRIQVVSTVRFVIVTRNYFISCTVLAEHQSGTYVVITIKRSLHSNCVTYRLEVRSCEESYQPSRQIVRVVQCVLSSVLATENSGLNELGRQDLPQIS